MNHLENLVRSCLFSMFDLILEQFKLYLKGSNQQFLQIQPNENEFITSAKRSLLEFETNIVKAAANIHKFSTLTEPVELESINLVQSVNLGDLNTKKSAEISAAPEQSKVTSQNIQNLEPLNEVESSNQIVRYPELTRLTTIEETENESPKTSQPTSQTQFEEIEIKNSQQDRQSSETEQLKSQNNVHAKIGQYLRSKLTPEKCDELKATTAQFRNAKYFNIRGHRDKVFEFYRSLLKNITCFYSTSDEPVTSQPDKTNCKIGQKVIDFLTQGNVKKITYALENYAHSDVKNFDQKLIMFDGLELMMQLIGK